MKLVEKMLAIIFLLESCRAQSYLEYSHEPAQRNHYVKVSSSSQDNYEIYNKHAKFRKYISISSEAENCGKCSCIKCKSKPRKCCKKKCNSCRKDPLPNFEENCKKCTCIKCKYKPKKCCKAICDSCSTFQDIGQPSSLFMVPYAMPYFVYPPPLPPPPPTRHKTENKDTKKTTISEQTTSSENKTTTQTTKATTTTKLTTTGTSSTQFFEDTNIQKLKFRTNVSTKCPDFGKCIPRNNQQRKERISQILKEIKSIAVEAGVSRRARITPITELPKYGLIPISDDIADHIMSQLN